MPKKQYHPTGITWFTEMPRYLTPEEMREKMPDYWRPGMHKFVKPDGSVYYAYPVSKHAGHKGFRRVNGRIYCKECDNQRNRERKAYNRDYQRKLRRAQGRPSSTPAFDRFLEFSKRQGGIFTIDELSEALGISRDTVASWAKRGWLDTRVVKNRTGKGAWRSRVEIEV